MTERRRLDALLAAARDAAEAASRAKSAFLANTSHEIRTPLNGLLGLARLALVESLPAETRRYHLEQILACAQGLEGILSNILDFSKIEAGKFTLESSAFDLRSLLAAVQASYRPITDAKGLTLELEVESGLASVVNGDPVRIRQILGNFITNAVKFTVEGGIRILAAAGSAGGVRLAVVDSGSGVDAQLFRHLFQPFSQGDASTTRAVGGTGLGLSICRQLARLMGGDVGVESRAGAGSTFWAELPLPATVLPGDSLTSEASEHERLREARILLVEDNPVNMMIAVATLAQWGVDVAEARDGRAAIEAVHEAARGGRPFDPGAHGRADAADERPRGCGRVAQDLGAADAADRRPDRRGAGLGARSRARCRHERLPDQADRRAEAAPHPGAPRAPVARNADGRFGLRGAGGPQDGAATAAGACRCGRTARWPAPAHRRRADLADAARRTGARHEVGLDPRRIGQASSGKSGSWSASRRRRRCRSGRRARH